MNILYIAPLLCVICYVFASEADSSATQVTGKLGAIEDDASRFKEAIEKGEMGVAKDVFGEGNNEQRKYYGEYLVGLGREKLVELIKNSRDCKSWLLSIIMLRAEEGLINEVFKEVEPSDWDWRDVARSADLACVPIKFINLLKRITAKDHQKKLLNQVFLHCLMPTRLSALTLCSLHLK